MIWSVTRSHHGPTRGTEVGCEPLEEATCPFCHKVLRSDADSPEFCGLCGMGVYHPDTAPSINTMGDQFIYFCCSWCLKLYVRDVKHSHEGPQEGEEHQGCS